MKLFAQTIAILALTPALAQAAPSTWELATGGATEAYLQDFRSESGRAAPEPIGYFLESAGDETLSRVYFADGTNLRAFDYGCHQHGRDFDCHRENRADLGAYRRSTQLYGAKEMKQSVPLAIELFESKIGPASTIRTMKFWEAEQNIRFVIGYEKSGITKTYFLACHFHGAELDCHYKRDAGPGEPK